MIPIAVYGNSAWDKYTITTPAWKEWMMSRPEMVMGWAPYQQPNIGVYKSVIIYLDTYAIYNNTPAAATDVAVLHPDWILHDNAGNPLFIPWGGANGTFPQFAGDLTNPAFRANQIAAITSLMKTGYQGVFLDDMNMSLDVCNQAGVATVPSGYNEQVWAASFVTFAEEVRAAFPKATIIHNAVWFDAAPQDLIDRQIKACNYYNMERGYGDPNLNSYTIAQQLEFVQHIHSLGTNVIQEEYSQNPIAPGTFTLQDKINFFILGYKAGDLMTVNDLFPDDTGNGWALMDAAVV